MTELYGDWPKIKALVDGEAKGAPLLRELFAELQRRKAGFEGTFSEVFREMTGYPKDQKITFEPLYDPSFWMLRQSLMRDGRLVSVGQRSGATIYRVSAEDGPEPEPTGTRQERPLAWPNPPTWRNHAMEAIRELTPSQFERLVARWARAILRAGLEVEVTKPSADGGFDVVVSFPPLDGKVRIEAKRWNTDKVGAPEVRNLRGALHLSRGDKGILIAPGGFTKAALTEAKAEGKAQVTLVDGDQLLDDMKKHELGLKVEMVEQVTVDRNWFRSLEE